LVISVDNQAFTRNSIKTDFAHLLINFDEGEKEYAIKKNAKKRPRRRIIVYRNKDYTV